MVLHLNKLESPSLKDALCQVCFKFAQWIWRRGFFNFVNVFSVFRNYLHLEKGGALYLNKVESPSPKDALCQVWLKLAQWFWRRRFLNLLNVFLLFRNYLPLKKGGALHLNKLESPSPKDALCQVWLKLAVWFWRRRWKCEKFTTTTTTTTTDNGQILIRKAHLSLRLRWVNKKMQNVWHGNSNMPVSRWTLFCDGGNFIAHNSYWYNTPIWIMLFILGLKYFLFILHVSNI